MKVELLICFGLSLIFIGVLAYLLGRNDGNGGQSSYHEPLLLPPIPPMTKDLTVFSRN